MKELERNLDALSTVVPSIREILLEDPGDVGSSFQVEHTSSGVPTAKRDGLYLHSRRDPPREAGRIIESLVPDAPGIVVILGFGLGYHLEAALSLRKEATVIVIEPDLRAFRSALAARDLGEALSDPRSVLVLAAAADTIVQVLRQHDVGECSVIVTRAARTGCFASYWLDVDTAIAAFRRRKEINHNTLIRFGRLWVRNLARNLAVLTDSRPVQDLTSTMVGLPALVMGAGPSLDTILPFLPSLRRRMVVIAVDTALPSCLAQGVEPDFLVVVDPQYWNSRHLDRCKPTRTILVSDSSTHPRVFSILEHLPTYLCSSLFPLGEYLEEAIGLRGKLGAGGSVSTTAWDAARLFGSSQIIIAGVDLGFPGRATHCRGSFFEERTHLISHRLKPAESGAFLYLHDAEPYAVESYDGSSVLTDKRMEIYRWWFENQVELHPDTTTYTVSGGGVRIRGIEPISVESILKLPDVREQIDQALHTFRKPHPPVGSQATKRLSRSLSVLDQELARLEALAERAAETVKDAINTRRSGQSIDAHLAILQQIDSRIYSVGNRQIPSFLMQDVIAQLTADTEGDPLQKSDTLYRAMWESVAYHRFYLRFRGLKLL